MRYSHLTSITSLTIIIYSIQAIIHSYIVKRSFVVRYVDGVCHIVKCNSILLIPFFEFHLKLYSFLSIFSAVVVIVAADILFFLFHAVSFVAASHKYQYKIRANSMKRFVDVCFN